jgi:hypothetical protein
MCINGNLFSVFAFNGYIASLFFVVAGAANNKDDSAEE